MSIELADLAIRSKTLDVPFGECTKQDDGTYVPVLDATGAPLGQLLTVTFAPGRVTNKRIKALGTTSNLDALIGFISAIVTGWDLTRDGVPVGLTSEALDDVELEVLEKVVEAITKETQVNPTNAAS